MTVRISN